MLNNSIEIEIDKTRGYLYRRLINLDNTKNYYLARPIVDLMQSLLLNEYSSLSQESNLKEFFSLLKKNDIAETENIYPGSTVWMSNGVKIMELIVNMAKNEMRDIGYDEYIFPNFVEEQNFSIMKEKIYDFGKDIFKIQSNGVSAIMKPTGEPIIYPIIANWLKSGNKQLPLKIFQQGSYWRFKSSPHPYLKPMDSALMLEAHGFFENEEDMNEEFIEAQMICEKISNKLCFSPYIVSRPINYNKPVSNQTVAFDVLLPTGKTIQTLLVYKQGQVFSKPFNIKSKLNREYTHNITYGFTERTIYTTLLLHLDRLGLRIPSSVAPCQIVIACRDGKNNTINKSKELQDQFKKNNIRSKIIHFTDLDKKHSDLLSSGVPMIIFLDSELTKEKRVEVFNRQDCSIKKVSEDFAYSKLLIKGDKHLRECQDNIKNANTANIDHISDKNNEKFCHELTIHPSDDCIDKCQSRFAGELLGIDISFSSDKEKYCVACGKICNTRGYIARRV